MQDWEYREGETPYEDLDGFVPTQRYPNPTRQQVDEFEEENIRKATLKYLAAKPSTTKAPFTYPWLLSLHEEMYGEVWEWAGSIRIQNTQIGLDKYQIPEALRALVSDIPKWPDFFKPIEIAARIHHRAVEIHPFKNGNGRWSRLLANIWLKQRGLGVIEWPSIVGERPIRAEYIQAIRLADGLDYDPLIEMHKRYIINE